jgi:uncharacterized protein YdaU (DUF1376 family)
MAKSDIWMPLYPGDYLRDTTRLTTEQHGAYLLLIMDYWTNGPPPDNDVILAQITRMSLDAWSNASSTIRAFFEHQDGVLIHHRINKEIEAAKVKKADAVAKATRAAEIRWQKDASSNASSNNQAMLEQCPSPSPTESPSKTKAKSKSEAPEANQAESKSLQPAAPTATKKKAPLTAEETALKAVCRATWESYSRAYNDRYNAMPTGNATVYAQLKQFCKRVPGAEAPHIAAFYCLHNAAFYVTKGHAVGQLLADAEKLRTEWATNRTITQSQARQVDETQGRGNVWGEIIEEARERERNEAIQQTQ